MRIIGVDFSGAQYERKSATWLAQGRLEGKVLTLETCHPIIRADLTDWLRDLDEPAVVGMDFPFSVPVEFANFWCPQIIAQNGSMPDVWATTARLRLGDFKARRRSFAGMPIRPCDPQGSLSPLNVRMMPMTFWGMRMLNRLWAMSEAGRTVMPVRVLPLHPDPERDSLTLLEVMPGATLGILNLLPAHKEYKGRGYVLEDRQAILTALPNLVAQLGLNLAGLPDALTQTCRANDDALDAVIAAITAALWSIGIPAQRDPAGCPDAELVGWMYVPQQANQ